MYTRNPCEEELYKTLKKARVSVKYEEEKLPYTLARNYIPDFTIVVKRHKIYIEYKGYLRVADKSKLRAIKQQYPTMDLRIIFHPKSKAKDHRWAEKNKIPYAIGTVPKEWLNE